MTDTISHEELNDRLIEANRRGKVNYTPYLDPNASYVVRTVSDLQEGLLLPDANRVSLSFRKGWDDERARRKQERMAREHPELELLIATRDRLKTALTLLTETINRVEKDYQ